MKGEGHTIGVMGIVIVLVILAVVIGLLLLYLFGLAKLFVFFWRRAGPRQIARRAATFAVFLLALCAPYLAFKAFELRFVLARVPEPLDVAWIDYRHEEHWGIGLPSDNETGFVVYRLREGSAHWARSKSIRLPDELQHESNNPWLPTPVDEWNPGAQWHDEYSDRSRPAHPADVAEYLDRYGRGISVDRRWRDQANRAIRQPGSFYRYEGGGRVTIIDPAAGYVYVVYAG